MCAKNMYIVSYHRKGLQMWFRLGLVPGTRENWVEVRCFGGGRGWADCLGKGAGEVPGKVPRSFVVVGSKLQQIRVPTRHLSTQVAQGRVVSQVELSHKRQALFSY